MPFTVENISAAIRNAKAQEEQFRANMNAAAGAVQAYEQLLTELIQDQRNSAAAPALPVNDALIPETSTKKRKR